MRDAIFQAITSNTATATTGSAAATGGLYYYLNQHAGAIGIICTILTTMLFATQIFFSMWLKWEERRDRRK